MDSELKERLLRAKELLRTVRHASMATVNEDGSPHNTPFLFLYNKELTRIFWGSHMDSDHSVNILRTGQIFVVLYDAIERGGLYIRAKNGHVVFDSELDEALNVHNEFRKKEGREPIQVDYYKGESPQRMWSADITNFWVPSSERKANGDLIRDIRIEVTASDLIE